MGAWEESAYAWIVICKNKRFHKHTNVMYGHKIPLAETDAFATPPAVSGPFTVQCDECGQEHDWHGIPLGRGRSRICAKCRKEELEY